eukprot:g6420.t1
MDEQLLVPVATSITGAADPTNYLRGGNNVSKTTVFLATRGVTEYGAEFCEAADMVTTRVGFVLSSYVTMRNLSFQGADTIRPGDNGALCGGGAFETKGCAASDCSASGVNNGGSDGVGSMHVLIENVRLNDYYHEEDKGKIGAHVPGNADCPLSTGGRPTGGKRGGSGESGLKGGPSTGCCFCKPNGIRATQVGVWVPATRNTEGTSHVVVRNVVSSATQADGINLHGRVTNAFVENAHFANTGDDVFAVWGADLDPENVTFAHCTAVDPGILRPNWYGNCVATYGLREVTFVNLTCRVPTLRHPLPNHHPDSSMFVFFTSFGGHYPPDNAVNITGGWSFTDLSGRTQYQLRGGALWNGSRVPGKMAWTKTNPEGIPAPYYLPTAAQQVNVHVAT